MCISSKMYLHTLPIVEGQKRCFRSRIGVASEEIERDDLAMIGLEVLDPTVIEDMYNVIRFLEKQSTEQSDTQSLRSLVPITRAHSWIKSKRKSIKMLVQRGS